MVDINVTMVRQLSAINNRVINIYIYYIVVSLGSDTDISECLEHYAILFILRTIDA